VIETNLVSLMPAESLFLIPYSFYGFGGIRLEEKTTFGERLKQLRLDHNLTQEAMAEKLQTVRSTINKYEKNTRKPEYETLIKIADLFQTTTDYLLGRTHQK
jgi:DNA-binding XRE family transcriptional regulator